MAHDLLGKLLVRRCREGAVAVRLVGVEAYLGPADPACHAYVYLIYGVHHCLNLVTVGGGAGEAVLVRGAAVVHGKDLVRCRRGTGVAERSLIDGPGKLGQALAISLADDARVLCDPRGGLWLCDDGVRIGARWRSCGPRVGVGSAGEAADWPLRFKVTGGLPGAPS